MKQHQPPPIARSRINSSQPSNFGPIITLLLLAPVISEVLLGAVRFSTAFVVVPEILTWGCGALLIRESVRRWHKGWPSMLLRSFQVVLFGGHRTVINRMSLGAFLILLLSSTVSGQVLSVPNSVNNMVSTSFQGMQMDANMWLLNGQNRSPLESPNGSLLRASESQPVPLLSH